MSQSVTAASLDRKSSAQHQTVEIADRRAIAAPIEQGIQLMGNQELSETNPTNKIDANQFQASIQLMNNIPRLNLGAMDPMIGRIGNVANALENIEAGQEQIDGLAELITQARAALSNARDRDHGDREGELASAIVTARMALALAKSNFQPQADGDAFRDVEITAMLDQAEN